MPHCHCKKMRARRGGMTMGARKRGGMEKMGARKRRKGAGLWKVGKQLYGMVPNSVKKEIKKIALKEGKKVGEKVGQKLLNKATQKIQGRKRRK